MSETDCSKARTVLGAHADGQLDPVKTLEVEAHLAACEECRERLALDQAIRGSLKKDVQTKAPDALRARMLAAMAAETAREGKRNDDGDSEGSSDPTPRADRAMLRHWRTMLPLASAAALAMAWGFAGRQPIAQSASERQVAGAADDDLLREFVAQHSHPLRPETDDRKKVTAFERDVGVPVRVPRFQQNARFLGGRVMPVHGGERAAMLQYEVGVGGEAKRAALFIYDPARVKVRGFAAPRAVGTAAVQVGRSGAYSVAVTEHGGVGYAVVSELDQDSSADLVATADRE